MPSRRHLLAGVGAALVGGTGAAATERTRSPSTSSSPFDWPMSQHDPAGTGSNPEASGPSEDVGVAWVHDATDWFRGASPPILLGDTLYAAGDGLLALEADTGERRFGRRGPYTSSPAVASASPYRTPALAVTSTGGVTGLNADGGVGLSGADRGIGSRRWTVPEGGEYRPTLEHRPAVDPVTVDGTVYATVYGTNDVVALDAADGSERWRVTAAREEVGASFGRPTVRDGTLFVANWPNRVAAYDREDGTERWRREREDQMQLCSPATDAGIVVLSRSGVSLLDDDDGSPVWERDLEGNATGGTVAVAEGTAFLSDGRDRFHALALETGESLWSTPFETETTPVVADGTVYAVEGAASLVALDAETGAERFRYEPPEAPLSAPIVGDGCLYAVNRGRVLALEEPR